MKFWSNNRSWDPTTDPWFLNFASNNRCLDPTTDPWILNFASNNRCWDPTTDPWIDRRLILLVWFIFQSRSVKSQVSVMHFFNCNWLFNSLSYIWFKKRKVLLFRLNTLLILFRWNEYVGYAPPPDNSQTPESLGALFDFIFYLLSFMWSFHPRPKSEI